MAHASTINGGPEVLTRPYVSVASVRRRWHKLAPVAMAVPFLVLFCLFFAVPLVYATEVSLKSESTGSYVGLSNYSYVAGLGDFWSGVGRVAYFGVIQVSVMLGMAMALALLLDSPYCKGRRFFATVYFMPYAIPGVIASIMWGFLYYPQLDSLLRVPLDLHLTGHVAQPLSPAVVLYSIMLIVTWEYAGYNMTIYLTSLTSIPSEILDAARVDGASEWKTARYVKMPMLRRTVIFTLVLSIIGTLQLFNEPSIINELTTLGNSYTPNLLIYSTAFSFGNEPVAAAESIILALITIVGTVAFFSIVKRRDGEQRRSPLARRLMHPDLRATQAEGRQR